MRVGAGRACVAENYFHKSRDDSRDVRAIASIDDFYKEVYIYEDYTLI